MSLDLEALALAAGVPSFTDYQVKAFEDPAERLCLYYKTGAGKTITALVCLALRGVQDALVIAPPVTHPAWVEIGGKLGINVQPMSHAKFRMHDTLVSRSIAIVADEMHLFGGHGKKGWLKLERVAKGLKAPLIMASATPNYNDADRVYCIQRILDPGSCHGGFLEFLYKHCTTEQNMFGMMPIVTGFQRFADSAEYLASLPGVHYLPDDLVYTIQDDWLPSGVPPELETYGYNRRRHRMVASGIEKRHAIVDLTLIDNAGGIQPHILSKLKKLLSLAKTPVLIFANHSTVAFALAQSLEQLGIRADLAVGTLTTKKKNAVIEEFRQGRLPVLIGTATLATGSDGLDKVCNTLIILDDTEDDSLRRQLIGRIMPRGLGGDASSKTVHRLSIL